MDEETIEKDLTQDDIQKMIDHTIRKEKLDIAEKKITPLIFLVTVIGIILPTWSTYRSHDARKEMEQYIQARADAYFKYPELKVTVNGKPLAGQILNIPSLNGKVRPSWIQIENISNVSAGMTEITLYIREDVTEYVQLEGSSGRYTNGLDITRETKEPGYDTLSAFPLPGVLYAKTKFEASLVYSRLMKELSEKYDNTVSAKLVIRCTLAEPIEIPFTINFVD